MQRRTLKVVPNPYAALDCDGRAQAAVELEGVAGQYVGAVLDPEESRKTRKHVFRFTGGGGVTVPLTAYYLRRLREGALLPADEATARAAAVKFVPPEEALDAWRTRAVAEFITITGQPPLCAPAEPA